MKFVMNPCSLIFFMVLGYQQTNAQPNTYDALFTIQNASKQFADSLTSHGIDTMIHYYFGYAACPSASSPIAYIYWSGNGSSQVTVFKEYLYHKRKKSSVRMTIESHEYDEVPFPVDFFRHNYEKIAEDTLVMFPPGKETIYVFNHPFEFIDAKIGGLRMKYDIMCSQRNYNLESYKIAFIDNFRSFILSYYYTNWTMELISP